MLWLRQESAGQIQFMGLTIPGPYILQNTQLVYPSPLLVRGQGCRDKEQPCFTVAVRVRVRPRPWCNLRMD